MSTALLIAGFSEQLIRACVSEGQRKGFEILAALPVSSSLAEFADPAVTAITWTPRSAISAKSLILKAYNRSQNLSEALLVVEIPQVSRAFHEASYSDLDQMIDTYVKGPVFLARELLGTFVDRRRGGLSVVIRSSGYEASPIARSLRTALESLFDSILNLYQRESVVLRGFLAGAEDEAEIARQVLEEIASFDRKPQKRFRRLGGKSGLFPVRK
ncbi:MAG: hypothetical protein ACOCW6_05000 [Spirochaetota bacterium]